jgi:hypothetical protein
MISTLFRRSLWVLFNLIIFGVLVGGFWFEERLLGLLEGAGHDMKDRLFWEFRPWQDFFYVALFFGIAMGGLYLGDLFQDGALEAWQKIFGPEEPRNAPPKKPRFTFWEKLVLALAAVCAALIIGAFPRK